MLKSIGVTNWLRWWRRNVTERFAKTVEPNRPQIHRCDGTCGTTRWRVALTLVGAGGLLWWRGQKGKNGVTDILAAFGRIVTGPCMCDEGRLALAEESKSGVRGFALQNINDGLFGGRVGDDIGVAAVMAWVAIAVCVVVAAVLAAGAVQRE